jgi:hypothetical protein
MGSAAVAGYGESARGDDWALGWVYDQGDAIEIRRSRVLAECEAHRRIVEAYRGLRTMASNFSNEGANGEAETARAMYAGLDLALRALASVYADHPDFREEWRL